jgi:hypothetical protein
MLVQLLLDALNLLHECADGERESEREIARELPYRAVLGDLGELVSVAREELPLLARLGGLGGHGVDEVVHVVGHVGVVQQRPQQRRLDLLLERLARWRALGHPRARENEHAVREAAIAQLIIDQGSGGRRHALLEGLEERQEGLRRAPLVVTLHEAALQVGQGLDHVQHQLYAYAARAHA